MCPSRAGLLRGGHLQLAHHVLSGCAAPFLLDTTIDLFVAFVLPKMAGHSYPPQKRLLGVLVVTWGDGLLQRWFVLLTKSNAVISYQVANYMEWETVRATF